MFMCCIAICLALPVDQSATKGLKIVLYLMVVDGVRVAEVEVALVADMITADRIIIDVFKVRQKQNKGIKF
jgi:hypothetical protein